MDLTHFHLQGLNLLESNVMLDCERYSHKTLKPLQNKIEIFYKCFKNHDKIFEYFIKFILV
jgi:hypothetical protein